MADSKTATAQPKAKTVKVPKQTKPAKEIGEKDTPKKSIKRGKYDEMVLNALFALSDRKGSTRAAIFNYIVGNNDIGSSGNKLINKQMKSSIERLVEDDQLVVTSGTGFMARWKLSDSSRNQLKKIHKVQDKENSGTETNKMVKKLTPKKSSTPKKVAKSAATKKSTPESKAAKKVVKSKTTPKKAIKKTTEKAAEKTTEATPKKRGPPKQRENSDKKPAKKVASKA